MYPDIVQDENWKNNFVDRLTQNYLEHDCHICKNKVPEEGIVLRFDGLNIDPYKLKSKRFVLKESENKEKEDFVDIEDNEVAVDMERALGENLNG